MRFAIVLFGAAMTLAAADVSASPFSAAEMMIQPAPAVLVHHKPGHHGGPPWTRGRQYHTDSFEDGRRYDERRYYEARPRYRRQVCRTAYRTVFDRYSGDYISRPVRTCTSEY